MGEEKNANNQLLNKSQNEKKFKPYYAVIFTSTQNENIEGYSEMADKMEHLAKQQNGFLGMESARNNLGITAIYWETLEAIENWKHESVSPSGDLAYRRGRQERYRLRQT